MDLSKLTTPIIQEIKPQLNLTNEETIVFDMLCKGETIVKISQEICVSTRTVDNRIKIIKHKIKAIGGLENERNSDLGKGLFNNR